MLNTPDRACLFALAIETARDIKARKECAQALIAVAVEISRQRGYGGRVVLSSTPESEKFYERIGFRRTGATDGEGLAVFHLPAASVTRFLKSYPPLKAA